MEKRCARRLVRANVLLTAGRVLLALRGLREGIACVEQALDEYQQALDEVLARVEPSTNLRSLGCVDPTTDSRDNECVESSIDPRGFSCAEEPGHHRSRCGEDANRHVPRYVEDVLSEEDWLMLDSCRARIDATVETCRNLGYRAGRGSDGSWRVRFGL